MKAPRDLPSSKQCHAELATNFWLIEGDVPLTAFGDSDVETIKPLCWLSSIFEIFIISCPNNQNCWWINKCKGVVFVIYCNITNLCLFLVGLFLRREILNQLLFFWPLHSFKPSIVCLEIMKAMQIFVSFEKFLPFSSSEKICLVLLHRNVLHI